MKITQTKLAGLLLIEPRVFADNRGFFYETYHIERYCQQGLSKPFVQDNVSRSTKGVLRGLHYQLRRPQVKLVTVLRGAVLDVALDIRQGSPTFGQWEMFELSDKNHHQLYVPEGFAHGFVALSDEVDFLYKCTDFYQPGDEYGIIWNDPELNIPWGTDKPVMSDKDLVFPTLKDAPIENLPTYKVNNE